MAQLLITDDMVTIGLSRKEKILAAHGNQKFLRSAISGARAVPDCIAEVQGWKGPGTGILGIRMGSWHDDGRVTFAVCHGSSPGLSST
jgi:hypothetical protein